MKSLCLKHWLWAQGGEGGHTSWAAASPKAEGPGSVPQWSERGEPVTRTSVSSSLARTGLWGAPSHCRASWLCPWRLGGGRGHLGLLSLPVCRRGTVGCRPPLTAHLTLEPPREVGLPCAQSPQFWARVPRGQHGEESWFSTPSRGHPDLPAGTERVGDRGPQSKGDSFMKPETRQKPGAPGAGQRALRRARQDFLESSSHPINHHRGEWLCVWMSSPLLCVCECVCWVCVWD